MNNENNNDATVLGNVYNPQTSVPNQNSNLDGMSGSTIETLDGLTPPSDSGTFVNNANINQSQLNNADQPLNAPQVENNNFQNNSATSLGKMNASTSNEPTPAFTNPQAIAPGPMPGFENSIGTTPPISLEPEKTPKKKSSKIAFIIIVLIVLAGVGFGTFYVLRYTDLLNNKTARVKIETKDLEVNLNERLSSNISDYATITGTAISNCSVDTLNVDLSKVGTYEYTISCGETRKKGTINVVDNIELEAEVKTVYKGVGETLEAKEFAKNENSDLTFEFVNNNEINNILNGNVGKYVVKLKVSRNDKVVEIDGNLVIVANPIKGYLTCSTNPQIINDISATMTIKEKFAIAGFGTSNVYGGIAFEVHEFKISDETQYNNYIAQYKTEKTITINEITGDVSFDDETKTITITNELNNDTIMSEYGAKTFETYTSLSTYFRETLGYSCRFDR